MRLPFISRRRHESAVDFLAAVHRSNLSIVLKAAAEDRAARRKAESRAAALDKRLHEMQLASELHDQQLHAKEDQ